MKVLILANGDAPSAEFLAHQMSECDLFMAVDGAAHTAIDYDLKPDIVCGDFDSADIDLVKKAFPAAEFIPLPDQNYTDLEKTIRLAIQRGAKDIAIAGAMGGRIDHALGSLSVLLAYHDQVRLRVVDERSEMRVLSAGGHSFATAPGDTISLLAYGADVCVTLIGTQWPLQDKILAIGTHGISNLATGDSVTLRVSGGLLVFCRLTPPDASTAQR